MRQRGEAECAPRLESKSGRYWPAPAVIVPDRALTLNCAWEEEEDYHDGRADGDVGGAMDQLVSWLVGTAG